MSVRGGDEVVGAASLLCGRPSVSSPRPRLKRTGEGKLEKGLRLSHRAAAHTRSTSETMRKEGRLRDGRRRTASFCTNARARTNGGNRNTCVRPWTLVFQIQPRLTPPPLVVSHSRGDCVGLGTPYQLPRLTSLEASSLSLISPVSGSKSLPVTTVFEPTCTSRASKVRPVHGQYIAKKTVPKSVRGKGWGGGDEGSSDTT